MLGFGPIAGTGNTISGSVQWINPLDDLAFITSDVWQLARYIGQRSSVSGFPARPLYKPELCMSSKSLVSSKILTEGRLLGKRPDGRPVYKVNASYYYNPSLGIPPAPTSEYTWGRLVGSRSSFTSNTSLISGRLLYAARPPCKENQTPSSFSARPSSSSYSFVSGSPSRMSCCPDRTAWPYRLKVTFVQTLGTCPMMDALNGAEMYFGPNPWIGYLNGCNPAGYGWYGVLPGVGTLTGVPGLVCNSGPGGSGGCRLIFFIQGSSNEIPRLPPVNRCNGNAGSGGAAVLGYSWHAHDPDFIPFFGPTVCDGIFPLTGTLTFTQGFTGTIGDCCAFGEPNAWDFTIDVQAEP